MRAIYPVILLTFLMTGCGEEIRHDQPLTLTSIKNAETVIGVGLTDAERELMQDDLMEQREGYLEMHRQTIDNAVTPSQVFDPRPDGWRVSVNEGTSRWSDAGRMTRPENLNDLAYATVGELGYLLRNRLVTSEELTRLSLDRLRKYGPELECVVSLTEQRALDQARRADREIEAGQYRGPLHGIPYGAKDLLAVAGYKTTWGAMPYKDQVIDQTAVVVQKLDEAGAVLVAKLTLGALAWGDVWFGGTTRNPWNLEEGSSGSSAGPASAVAAGLVPFAIGTETWGSIVSPSTRCGLTGLRPTYGRVSRTGAMALSWSMDKIGPMARTVEDCAMVFDVIQGADPQDLSLIDAPFVYRPEVDLAGLRIGYLKDLFAEDYPGADLDHATLETMRELGAELIPVSLPERNAYPISIMLSVEAAAAFEELTLSGRDDQLVRQVRYAWPNVFRSARFIPAVEYVQADRARHLLINEMAALMRDVDVYISPSFGGQNLLVTNLTGHPCVVLPNGFTDEDSPHSITFMGDLFDEATVLAVARAYQQATDFHLQHPEGY
jgi:Asp-tRNA(Asn)/Glu-tRNA(Gln) amidotransferase A subunit family amidase